MAEFQTFFSNRIEILFERLKETLFQADTSPFSRRMIIAPNPMMKSWLMLKMASDPSIGISLGTEISYLDQTIQKLTELAMPDKPHRLTRLELALAIEYEIRKLITTFSQIPEEDRAIWKPLLDYLKIQAGSRLSKKSEKRLTQLSDQLAALFMQYGKYGGKLIKEWEKTAYYGWQQRLWAALFPTPWSYSHDELTKRLEASLDNLHPSDLQIHIFAISYLPPIYHQFLMHLGKAVPVNYYVLSPCQLFWSDLRSNREQSLLQHFWKKKGVPQGQLLELEEYLRDNNPLLANIGRLGREMAQQIEESPAETFGDYAINSATAERYAEFMNDEIIVIQSEAPLTLLNCIQADMLLLRNPATSEKIELPATDKSLQVHVSSSLWREVEILYDQLLHLIARHADDEKPLCPRDILVMAPNIIDYAPYIKAVFGREGSLLRPHVTDISLPNQEPFFQAFLHLLSIPFGRWDSLSLVQLLRSPAFQKRHQFSHEDVHKIQEWIQSTGIRWGSSPLHRNEILRRQKCDQGMIEETPAGTWEHGFDLLLSQLASYDQESSDVKIDATQSELLGRWICLMRSLLKDLACLTDGTSLSLAEWVQYLRCLCDAYLAPEEEQRDSEVYNLLISMLDEFQRASQKLGELPLPFNTIHHHLVAQFNSPDEHYRESNLNSVRFCSLLPMRAIPAEVIAILGLEEGIFPRTVASTSLDLMHNNPAVGYYPSQFDYDRFLFLEALLSARSYLLMSYRGYAASDGKPQSPSLVVSELLDYIDRAFSMERKKPSKTCISEHPFRAFDKSYYEEGSEFFSYSQANYLAAIAHYHVDLTDAPTIPCPMPAQLSLENIPTTVSVRDLATLARNPIQTYFNKSLGMYFDKIDRRTFKTDEDFQLHPLDAYQLKAASLQKPLMELLERENMAGRLPIGPFKGVSLNKLQNDVELIQSHLKLFNVDMQNISEISMSASCQSPERLSSGNWVVPALDVTSQGKSIKIIGTLQDATPQGFLAHINDNRTDIVKAWPKYLIFCCLIKRYNLPYENRLLMTKSGKEKIPFFTDPVPLLENYLHYYFTALEQISPLVPEWIYPILTHSPEEFSSHMSASASDPFHKLILNEYLQWAMKCDHLIPDKQIHNIWNPWAQTVFADMYQHWYPPKKKGEDNADV